MDIKHLHFTCITKISNVEKCVCIYRKSPQCILWKYGLWSFQTGDTELERFLPKNQHTQMKLLNFEF